MLTVGQILQRKGTQVWSIQPTATVYEALQLMAEKGIGALVVIEGSGLVGIISERDYARKVILHGKYSRDTLVSEIMTGNVITVNLKNTTEECMAIMTSGHFRHLPVVQDEQVIGIVSIGDVVKAVIDEQEFVIQQLENYISGKR
jgi:CBS domain-containing protein